MTRRIASAALAALALLLAAPSALAGWAPHRRHAVAIRQIASYRAYEPTITLLVDPQGRPVGERWQRWINESQMPTITGTVVLQAPASLCVAQAASCTARAVPGQLPQLAAGDREGLYFELGHLFDWRYLTSADRRWLTRQWRDVGTPWTDTDTAIYQGTEDGLEGVFSAIYTECAFDRHADIAAIALNAPASATVTPAAARPRDARSTCAFIEQVRRP